MELPAAANTDAHVDENHRLVVQAIIPHGDALHIASVGHRVDDGDGADSGIDVKHETPFPKTANLLDDVNFDALATGREFQSPNLRSASNYIHWMPAIRRSSSDPNAQERYLRLATVSSSRQRVRNRRRNSIISEGTLRMPEKLITWNVATQSRPPLRIDMSGPTPTTYSPRNKPLYETNAPAYSFGRKEEEKGGGGRKAWSKLWFRSESPFTYKTTYEGRWPTISHYEQKSTLGPKQAFKTEFPSHSIGVRHKLHIVSAEKEDVPSSNLYTPDLAIPYVMNRAPSYSMGCRLPNNKPWVKRFNVPAPNVYSIKSSMNTVKRSHPAFTMCVQRRAKRHDIGPFATL